MHLTQNLSHKLVLSPQIRQYLKLLQMPAVELQTAVNELLTENPVVELKNEGPIPHEKVSSLQDEKNQTKELSHDAYELRFEAPVSIPNVTDSRSDEEGREEYWVPESVDANVREVQKNRDYRESLLTRQDSFSDFLMWQIRFLDLSNEERKLAEEMVGNLNEQGFLAATLEEIAADCQVDLSKAKTVLQKLQELDPPGVFAENLQDSLRIQIERMPNDHPELASRIVRECFSLLAKHDWNAIAKRLSAPLDEVRKNGEWIATLNPCPAGTFTETKDLRVVPDVCVSWDDEEEMKLKVELRHEWLPQVRINPYYRKLLRDPKTDAATRQFVREKIQTAAQFMQALELRGSTLKKIAEYLVKNQPDFFSYGYSSLKPMRLKDVAEEIGVHESSVSRAIHGKYMATPQGTVPLRSFFSTKLETESGEQESQKSVMHQIRSMIDAEDPVHPLSDQDIVQRLHSEGLKLARRTVTKYRELLKILPSHLRRRRS